MTGMSVLRNVVDLEIGNFRRDIVIRDITKNFWRACIKLVNSGPSALPRLRYWNSWNRKDHLNRRPHSHASHGREYSRLPHQRS